MLIIRLNKSLRLPHSIVVVHHQPPSSWAFSACFNSWALAIKKASSSSSPLQALQLYSQLQRQSLPVDSFSALFALKSCSHIFHGINIIRHLHAHLCKLGFGAHTYVATSLLHAYVMQHFHDARTLFDEMPHRNVVTWNVMITGFSRQGDIKNAYTVFDDTPLRDLGSWSAMISGYMHNVHWMEGLALFRKMVGDHCLKPNQMILCSVLSGCGRIGSPGLLLGKSLHGFAIKNEWELNVELSTCLIDLYTKYGLLNNAFLIFNLIRDSNVVTWTTLICGAAQNGYGKAALLIFEKMMKYGPTPNELTFTGILTACVQAGMVEEGRRYFRMIKECGLRPRIQHYGCMIDLFGKAGLLGDAYEVISTMPLEPNVVIWSSFLSSCKLHRQFMMTEKVIDQVMRIVQPENDGGVYSLMSDLYLLSGKWSEAENLRKYMCNQHVRKVKGYSCITSGVL